MNHSLSASDLECLDKLVALGRMLVPNKGNFYEAAALVAAGMASYAESTAVGVTITPTDAGRAMVAARADAREKRLTPRRRHRNRKRGGV